MKRKHKVLGTVLTASMLAASMAITASAVQITEDSAKTIALENVGITSEDILYMEAKLDYDDGKQIYEVDFLTKDYVEYDFDINAEDGTILYIEYDWKTAPISELGAKETVTLEQAKTLAIAHAGQTAETVTFKKTKTDWDDGRRIHEVDFYTADGKEYDYEIDAVTGTIIKWEYDTENYILMPQTVNPTPLPVPSQNEDNSSTEISEKEAAKAAALKHAGLSSANLRWVRVKPDYEDGRLVYEGEFYYNNLEYEFEIDAATGVIVNWEIENYISIPQTVNPTPSAVPSQNEDNPSTEITGIEAAKAAALKHAGLSSVNVIWGEVKPDYEDGRLVYEGEFYYNNLEYEFEIDAVTGVIIDWEIDD